MVFSSLTFLFIFLPLVLTFYFIIPQKHIKARNIVLLIFNLIFYAYGEPKNCIVMLLSIILNYIIGLLIDACEYKSKKAKFWVFIAAFLNLGVLVYFKYTTFIVENISNLFGLDIVMNQIIKPIGISFFTFQGLSYVIDVYRKDTGFQKSLFNVALYISLFPQLIAGPIVRYETIANEITERNTSVEDFALGIRRFMVGLGKKLILSNAIGQVADAFYNSPIPTLSVVGSWVGPIAYAFQIYFDFSAYSDMGIGLGRVFGFHFLENFNYPYISQSITEFWRRWHISLGTWFKDYVYIPLGGNRCSRIINIRNIFVVWMLTGIWHGAAWKFILWGVYFGIILILEKTFLLKVLDKLWRPIRHLYAIILIIIGWGIFRSYNLEYFFNLIKTMFFLNGNPFIDQKTIYFLTQFKWEMILCVIASLPLKNYIFTKHEPIKYIFAFAVFILGLICLLANSFNPFIYFRF